jgi:hypothetical protein
MRREWVALFVLTSVAVAVVACVLVEPPQELPVPAARRPLIVVTSVTPTARLDQPVTDLNNVNFDAFVDGEPSKAIPSRPRQAPVCAISTAVSA